MANHRTFFVWLSLWLGLSSCFNSVSERVDAKKRDCASDWPHLLPLVSLQDGELKAWSLTGEAKDWADILVRVLRGESDAQLSSRACLVQNKVSSDAMTLVADQKSQSFAIVQGTGDESLIMQPWSRQDLQWQCQSRQFVSQNFTLPLQWRDNLPTQALGLRVLAKRQGSESSQTLLTRLPGEGFTQLNLEFSESGIYQLDVLITDPFDNEYSLGRDCSLQVILESPQITVPQDVLSPDQNGILLKADQSLNLKLSDFASLHSCFARRESPLCENFQTGSAIVFPEAGVYLLRYYGEDPHGRKSPVQEQTVFVSPSQPKLEIQWQEKQYQKLLHAVTLPQMNFKAKLRFHSQDALNAAFLPSYSCRLSLKKGNSALLGRFAICDSKECQGQRLNRFVSCGEDFAFHFDMQDTSSSQKVDWQDFLGGGIQLEVEASDRIGSRDRQVLSLADFKVSNFPQWSVDPWPEQATTITDFALSQDRFFVRPSRSTLYQKSLVEEQDWQEVDLSSTDKDFDRMLRFGQNIWLMSRLQVYEGSGDGKWLKKSLPGLSNPADYQYYVPFVRVHEASQTIWIAYSIAGGQTKLVNWDGMDRVQEFPCELKGLKGPRGEDYYPQWQDVFVVGKDIYLFHQEGYIKASGTACSSVFLPEYENNGFKSRSYSYRLIDETKWMAFYPNGALRLEEGRFVPDEKYQKLLSETFIRNSNSISQYLETAQGNLITSNYSGAINYIALDGDYPRVFTFDTHAMGLSREDEVDFWIFDLFYRKAEQQLTIVSKWGLVRSLQSQSTWYETGWQSQGELKQLEVWGKAGVLWLSDRVYLAELSGAEDLSVGSQGEVVNPEALSLDQQGEPLIIGRSFASAGANPERRFYRIDRDKILKPWSLTQAFPNGLKPYEGIQRFTLGETLYALSNSRLLQAQADQWQEVSGPDGLSLRWLELLPIDAQESLALAEDKNIYSLSPKQGPQLQKTGLKEVSRLMQDGPLALAYGINTDGLPGFARRLKKGSWELLADRPWDLRENPILALFADRGNGAVCVIGKLQNYACTQGERWQINLTAPWPLTLQYASDAQFRMLDGKILSFWQRFSSADFPQSLMMYDPEPRQYWLQ